MTLTFAECPVCLHATAHEGGYNPDGVRLDPDEKFCEDENCFCTLWFRDNAIHAREAELSSLRSELEEARMGALAMVCHDAHCEFDCEGWRAVVDRFRESHGTRTAREWAEEFDAAERDLTIARTERDKLRKALDLLDSWLRGVSDLYRESEERREVAALLTDTTKNEGTNNG